LVRSALEKFLEVLGKEQDYFVLGSIGPAATGFRGRETLRDVYGRQLSALLDEGVNALLLETFTSLEEVEGLVNLISSEYPEHPPVIVEMALRRSATQMKWSVDPKEFVTSVVQAGAAVVGMNCCTPWDAEAFVEAVGELNLVRQKQVLLSIMPNAGGFQRIDNRYMTRVNPEFMGSLARSLVQRGVALVGGCCEVHPKHIREMHNFLHGYTAGKVVVEADSGEALEPTGDLEKSGNGPFTRKLKQGEFVVSVEILPSRGTAPHVLQGKVDFVEELTQSGLADAIDLTDGSRGIPLMPPGDFIGVVRTALGWDDRSGDKLEFIPHFTARDVALMGLQARLIGLHARRIRNVLFITGDPPKMGPTYPASSAVFDVDSVQLIQYTHGFLNAGVDFGGRRLGRKCDPRTHFTIGTGFEPEALDLERELEKLRRKIDAGADYVMTQPVFRDGPLEALAPFRDNTPILAGVMILTSLDHARRVSQVPGVIMPESVIERLAALPRVEDQAKLGVELAVEQIRKTRAEGWAGLYLMSPSSVSPIIEVLRAGLGPGA
jgi:homocysteine S-methyltransferase